MGRIQLLIVFYRRHFGSRFNFGWCGLASLFLPVRVLQLSCFLLSIPQGDCVPVFLGFLPSLILCSSSSACGSWPYSRGAQPVSLATFYTSFENQKKHWCYVSVTPHPTSTASFDSGATRASAAQARNSGQVAALHGQQSTFDQILP